MERSTVQSCLAAPFILLKLLWFLWAKYLSALFIFSKEPPRNHASEFWLTSMRSLLLLSEGKGHTFESCRVRQGYPNRRSLRVLRFHQKCGPMQLSTFATVSPSNGHPLVSPSRSKAEPLRRFSILPRFLVLGRLLVKLSKLRLQVFDLAPTLCLGFRLAPAGAHGGCNHRLRERG